MTLVICNLPSLGSCLDDPLSADLERADAINQSRVVNSYDSATPVEPTLNSCSLSCLARVLVSYMTLWVHDKVKNYGRSREFQRFQLKSLFIIFFNLLVTSSVPEHTCTKIAMAYKRRDRYILHAPSFRYCFYSENIQRRLGPDSACAIKDYCCGQNCILA